MQVGSEIVPFGKYRGQPVESPAADRQYFEWLSGPCVVFGRRTAVSKPLPDKVRVYSGTLPYRDAPEDVADKQLKVLENARRLHPCQQR